MSPEQREQLIVLKNQGLSKEQAVARVFAPARTERAVTGLGEVGEAARGLGRDIMQRGDTIREAFAAAPRVRVQGQAE